MVLETIQDLILVSKVVNHAVIYDASKRIMDWIGSGGTEKDDYVQKQLAYVSKMINIGACASIDIKQLAEVAKLAKAQSGYGMYE